MIRTIRIDSKDLGASLEHLRSLGVPEEAVAAFSAGHDDWEFSVGDTEVELDELRKKLPEGATFLIVRWMVVHSRREIA
jgi:hypothetical protein